MPRPGPRPYECVRRAWHSDRHQPMRGLIIQQILGLVQDNHSAATKKNREWQEKLPVVVFKAEEIMYSKANSEAEYSNAETLWDRVNDAVDTIIRKDESSEIGELLPPCVEAALNLGCVPVRASRSQRHNPRMYLRPAYQDGSHMPHSFPSDNAMQRHSNPMPLQIPNDSMSKPPNPSSPRLVWESNTRVMPNTNQHIDTLIEKFRPLGNRNNVVVDDKGNRTLNQAAVYPLYYGTSFKPEVCPMGIQELRKPDPIIVGVPVYSSAEPAEGVCLQNLFPCGQEGSTTEGPHKAYSMEDKGKRPHTGFDLSLRLGLFSDSNTSKEKGSILGRGGIADKFDKGLSKEEFPFFPMEPGRSLSSHIISEGANQSVDLVSRKRKLPFNADVESNQFFRSQDSTSFKFPGQWGSRGL